MESNTNEFDYNYLISNQLRFVIKSSPVQHDRALNTSKQQQNHHHWFWEPSPHLLTFKTFMSLTLKSSWHCHCLSLSPRAAHSALKQTQSHHKRHCHKMLTLLRCGSSVCPCLCLCWTIKNHRNVILSRVRPGKRMRWSWSLYQRPLCQCLLPLPSRVVSCRS